MNKNILKCIGIFLLLQMLCGSIAMAGFLNFIQGIGMPFGIIIIIIAFLNWNVFIMAYYKPKLQNINRSRIALLINFITLLSLDWLNPLLISMLIINLIILSVLMFNYFKVEIKIKA